MGKIRKPPTKLMPEKLRGKLSWRNIGPRLVLQHGGIVIAMWEPFRKAAGPRGYVSIYGEPRGTTVFYKSWHGWRAKLWNAYRIRPPATYHVGLI